MNEVELFVEEAKLSGWTSIQVVRSIETIANGFSLTISEAAPDDPARQVIRKGDACEVQIAGERVVAGFIQKVAPSYSPRHHRLTVTGWDATADLVKSSIVKSPKVPAKLEQIAAELCKPFEIEVFVEVDTGLRFESFVTEPGETVHAALDRVSRYRGVLLSSDGLGGLLITLPGQGTPVGELRKGDHILEASAAFDDAERYSEITFEAQRESAWGGGLGAPISATVKDPGVGRFLPLVELVEEPPTGQVGLEARARRELNLRAAQGQRVTYTVKGWRVDGDSGVLWKAGDLVTVRDEWLGINRDLLVTTATLNHGGGGRTTTLNLMRKEAFDLRELEQPEPTSPEFWKASEE